jgi:hypothetical protein
MVSLSPPLELGRQPLIVGSDPEGGRAFQGMKPSALKPTRASLVSAGGQWSVSTHHIRSSRIENRR